MNVFNFSSALSVSLFVSLWSLSAEEKNGFIRVTAIDKG
jgi:hypothetical protein